jgi:hypothetical protein
MKELFMSEKKKLENPPQNPLKNTEIDDREHFSEISGAPEEGDDESEEFEDDTEDDTEDAEDDDE